MTPRDVLSAKSGTGYSRIISRLGLVALALLLLGGAYPNTPDQRQATQTMLGDFLLGYVVSGCTHATSASTSVAIATCTAYVLNTGTPHRLIGLQDLTSRTVTYSGGDGTYWLIAHADLSTALGGWTRVAGTQYLWQKSTTQPTMPSQTLLLGTATVSGGAITAFETLAPGSPESALLGGALVYAAQYGMICDGTTDNSTALAAANAALPDTGGTILLPGGARACKFSTTLTLTTPRRLIGLGSERSGGTVTDNWGTLLEYTGAGAAIALLSSAAKGSRLQGFQLDHTGTGTVGIDVDTTSFVTIEDVTIFQPQVAFSIAGIRINGVTSTGNSNTYLIHVHVREAAPTCLELSIPTSNEARILFSQFRECSQKQVWLGRNGNTGQVNFEDTKVNFGNGAIGIYVENVTQLNILHSYIEGYGGPGITCPTDTGAFTCRSLFISHSRLSTHSTGATTSLIYLNKSHASLIAESNYVINGLGTPTFVQNAVANMVVLRNNAFETGWVLTSDREDVLFENNYVAESGAQLDGFYPYRLHTSVTGAGNVGTGVDVLQTATIPANTIFSQSPSVGFSVFGAGTTKNNTDNKQVICSLGATTVWNTGVIGSLANLSWSFDCMIKRSGASEALASCRGDFSGTVIQSQFTTVTLGTPWSSAQTFQCTGESGTATDDNIIMKFMQIDVRK